jgi:hypothetical protein
MPMTPEVHQKWTEAWQQAKAEKLKRREQNREEWRTSPKNAMNVRGEMLEALAVPGEPHDDESNGSSSLDQLRRIMGDPSIVLHRRIDAAEVLVPFEIAPGAATNVDPDQVAAKSFQFLRAVIDAKETPEALRFRALKCVAGIENARVQLKNSNVTNAVKKELLVKLVNAERNRRLRQTGRWPEIVASDMQWFVTTSDDLEAPAGWYNDSWVWPVAGFAAQLEHIDTERTAIFKQQLLAIRPANRIDPFDQLLANTVSAEQR